MAGPMFSSCQGETLKSKVDGSDSRSSSGSSKGSSGGIEAIVFVFCVKRSFVRESLAFGDVGRYFGGDVVAFREEVRAVREYLRIEGDLVEDAVCGLWNSGSLGDLVEDGVCGLRSSGCLWDLTEEEVCGLVNSGSLGGISVELFGEGP